MTADIAGGAYPAVINILLALAARQATGRGRHLDVAMADGLFTLAYWGLAAGFAEGRWPRPGKELVTGGSPRYGVYATASGRFLAVAAIEEKFWQAFCDIIDLPGALRDDAIDPAATRTAVAERVAKHGADEWALLLDGRDCCVSVVAALEDAVAGPMFAERRLFDRWVASSDGRRMPALPVPLDRSLLATPTIASVPRLDLAARPVWRPITGSTRA